MITHETCGAAPEARYRDVMLRALLVVLLVCAAHPAAEAGPYCGGAAQFGPEGGELPPGPTLAFGTEDVYYRRKRQERARPMTLTATIDGKRVGLRTRDVSLGDGVLRFVTVQSKRTGKLELWTIGSQSKVRVSVAEYVITDRAELPTKATGTVRRARDSTLDLYRLGRATQLAIRVDVPAIAFSLRWRTPKGAWKQRMLAVTTDEGHTEARLGETICGLSENVPMDVLAAGIEVDLTALLPDGTKLPVGGLPNPLVMPERKDGDEPPADE